MNRLKAVCMAVLAAYTMTSTAFASNIFSIKTSLDVTPKQNQCSLTVASGDVLEFSAEDLERRIGLATGALKGVTVTALPTPVQGALVLEGVEVEPYEFLDRNDLNKLCFVPNEAAASASLTLLPQGHDAVPTHVDITIMGNKNNPPTIENGSFSTVKNAQLRGFVTARDPDGDALSMKVIRLPKKGEVSFNGQSFLYQPFKNVTGSDSFTVCAMDPFGNYSQEALMEIKIESNRSGFRYADMANNPSEYAAIKLHEAGVYSGEKVGGNWFFHPTRQVNRGEFLVMLLAAAKLDKDLPPTVNTQLEGDSQLPMWLKPYVKAALNEGIWDASQPFRWEQIPTRAEAVSLTDRTAKITDVKAFDLKYISDVNDIPSWALPSYRDLAAYRMLDLHDNNAYPDKALTGSYAADLIWQLWKHYNR